MSNASPLGAENLHSKLEKVKQKIRTPRKGSVSKSPPPTNAQRADAPAASGFEEERARGFASMKRACEEAMHLPPLQHWRLLNDFMLLWSGSVTGESIYLGRLLTERFPEGCPKPAAAPSKYTPEESAQITVALETAHQLAANHLHAAARKDFQLGLLALADRGGGPIKEAEDFYKAHMEEFPAGSGVKELAGATEPPTPQALPTDPRALAAWREQNGMDAASTTMWEASNGLNEHIVRSRGLSTLLQAFVQFQATSRCGGQLSMTEADGIEMLLLHHQETLERLDKDLRLTRKAA